MPIRVLLVEGQTLLRHGMKLILQSARDIEVVAEAADGGEAVDRAAALSPDVVLIEPLLPRGDGVEAIRAIRQRCPGARILVLSAQGDQEALGQAAAAGAVGYVLKDISPENLVSAIRAASSGRAILSPTIAKQIVERHFRTGGDDGDGAGDGAVPRRDPGLTQHEIEVLRGVARGLSDKEIAAQLFLSESTVKSRLRYVYLKLGLRNRAHAAVFVLKKGLLAAASGPHRSAASSGPPLAAPPGRPAARSAGTPAGARAGRS